MEFPHQGFKEATFILMGRRSGHVEIGREAAVGAEQARVVTHSGVVDKNQEGYLHSERSQPQKRPYNPELQHQKDKSP